MSNTEAGHSSPVNAEPQGYTEAEGYAASLRQLAEWAETVPNDFDEDELRAAAAFIERQQAEIEALRINAQCVPSRERVALVIDPMALWHRPEIMDHRKASALEKADALLSAFTSPEATG